MTMHLLAWFPGPTEWIIIGAIGLILFGKRLPEVGRSLGKGIVEFKKGLQGVEDDIEQVDAQTAARRQVTDQKGFKYDPYTGKPVDPGAEPHKPEA